ncbi:hypothetical protein [Streptomyces sp. NPDC026673]|uniref:hypothetical protein n=1 Tax=Streptomyces sp. NPDC026673 TaxID=3155724 RepID=UPI0033F65811
MPEISPPPSFPWALAPPDVAAWLEELAGDGLTGFLVPAMPHAVWVLNAMYEHEQGPGDITYDEDERARTAEGTAQPCILAGLDPAALVTTGGGLGRAEHPGRGWRRLRWAELAQRSGDPVVPEGMFPCYRCFPSVSRNGSWPLGIQPPTEGSLDRETWDRLIAVLTEHSSQGEDARCLAYYGAVMFPETDFESPQVWAGRLGDAGALYDNPEVNCSPSNLWSEDRSWVVCTDWDLWASKVVGPTPLIEALLTDPWIEALRLPWNA